MDEKTRVKETLDQIEPAADAKARMLANIKRKAAEQAANEAPVQKTERAKVLTFNRVMKWALPIAACFVIFLAGALILPNLLPAGKNYAPGMMDAEKSAAADPSPSGDYYENAPRAAAANFFKEKEFNDAEIISAEGVEGQSTEYTFWAYGNYYSLSIVSNAVQKPVQDEPINKPDNNEEVQVIQLSSNAVLNLASISNTVVWSDEENSYVLTNTDGASQEEITKVYESLK